MFSMEMHSKYTIDWQKLASVIFQVLAVMPGNRNAGGTAVLGTAGTSSLTPRTWAPGLATAS